ncbi:MAG: VOC family protein [Proteobacteria bacterium]|nr:VOC family protein [Pseudomonadota bacterium]
MIGNLKYIAIAVPDLTVAIQQYKDVFGAFVTSPQDLPDQGMRLAVVKLPNTLLELITPLGEDSPLKDFLKANPQGGVHHLSYEVPDIGKAKDQLALSGIQMKGGETSQVGYHGNPVLSLDAKDFFGVSVELEQVSPSPVVGRVDVGRIGPAHPAPRTSSSSLEGVGGVGVKIEVDFKSPTPKDNQEGE